MLNRINKNLYKYIIAMLVVQVAFLKWLNLHNYGGYILDVLLTLNIVLNFKEYDKKSLILFGIFYLYFIINFVICGGTLYNIAYNVRAILPYTLLIPFTIWLINNKKDFIEDNFKKIFIPVNIYLLLNVVAIYFESKGCYKLSGINYNKDFTFTYFADSVSGLFGIYGQPTLALFFAFIILYNFIYAKQYLSNKNRKYLLFYNCLIVLYSLYISSIYDNKIFYIIVPCILLIYTFKEIISKYDICKKTIINICLILCLLLLVSFLLYYFVPFIKSTINIMTSVILTGFDYEHASGSSERIALIIYFAKKLNPVFGYGLGNGYWTEMWLLGYKHFGISELGTTLCLGGILLIIIYELMYDNLFSNIFKSKIITFVAICFMLIFSLSTQIVYNYNNGIVLIFIFILMQEKYS